MEKSKDRHASTQSPCGSSDDGHLKPQALTEEELARKREREAKKAADLDRKRSLFAGASTPAKKPRKPTETEKTHNTITRMIPLTPLPLSASQKKAKSSDKQFQRFNDLAQDHDAAAKFDLPSLDEMHELDRWHLELQNLRNMKPEPDDYCDRAETLLEKINETAPRFKKQFELISDAVSCLYVANEKRQICKTNNDIAGMRAWGEIVQSLQCLGVNKILTILSKRKKEEEIKSAQEAEARKKAAAAAAAIVRQASSQEEVAASPAIDLTEDSTVPIATTTNSCLVLDEDGELVELDSLFEGGGEKCT